MNEILEFMKMEKKQKLEKYRVLNAMAKKDEILFTGSSLMEQFPINELLMTNDMNNIIYNRGIGGYYSRDARISRRDGIWNKTFKNIY